MGVESEPFKEYNAHQSALLSPERAGLILLRSWQVWLEPTALEPLANYVSHPGIDWYAAAETEVIRGNLSLTALRPPEKLRGGC